jgi:hypothetical protein
MRRVIQLTAALLLLSLAATSAQQRGQGSPRSATGRAVSSPASAPRGGDRALARPMPTNIQPAFVRPRVARTIGVATFPVFWGWGLPLFYVGSPMAVAPLPDDAPRGAVQLDVTPWRSQVYVDGVLMGRVDDFKGYYHPLELTAGPHQITILDEGHQPMVLDVVVTPGRTITARATLPSR